MTTVEEALARFQQAVEHNGMAVASTSDGFVFCFQRQKLLALLLANTTPAVKIGIQTAEGMKEVLLSRNELQVQLDAHPEAPTLLVVYTHQPLQN